LRRTARARLATTVYLSIVAKAEATQFTILVDGKVVLSFSKAAVASTGKNLFATIRVKAKGRWEVKMIEGTLIELHATYQAG
jgi:aerobic-type carbon monoxide dehydrogenase small subunit (CoxS/CutS family)